MWPQLARGGAVCKVTEYVKMLSAEASVLNLAAVSFERYALALKGMLSWYAVSLEI